VGLVSVTLDSVSLSGAKIVCDERQGYALSSLIPILPPSLSSILPSSNFKDRETRSQQNKLPAFPLMILPRLIVATTRTSLRSMTGGFPLFHHLSGIAKHKRHMNAFVVCGVGAWKLACAALRTRPPRAHTACKINDDLTECQRIKGREPECLFSCFPRIPPGRTFDKGRRIITTW
jgi:hypothetical protein